MDQNSSIKEIRGIGDTLASLFEKLNIFTIKDLLFHIPYKYQDTSEVSSIDDFLTQGKGTFIAEIVSVKTFYTRFKKQITTVKVKDDTNSLSLIYFNQPYLSKTLLIGELYLFNAQVTIKAGKRSIYNPKIERLKDDISQQIHLGKLISVYSETKGLSSRTLRTKIKELKPEIRNIIPEPLNDRILKQNNLLTLPDAIEKIHFPENNDEIIVARERLAFDEMLAIAFRIEKEVAKQKQEKAKPIKIDTKLTNQFIKFLPYTLTDDQNSALETILDEISRKKPMNRLINGDVGSGKTVVSAITILNTLSAGYSAILIAPTTVLASQHYETFKKLFHNFDIKVELCISSEKTITNAKNKLIIGTHAILYQQVLPSDLNLVVIDEQHRFGVEQRTYLKTKTINSPHYLTMTATPIPRSLTEIFFGNLDVSEIKEKPADRKEIKTYYTPYIKRNDCFDWIIDKIKDSNYKEQAFVIYPLIEESEKTSVKSVLNEFTAINEKYSKDIKVAFLHGKLKPKDKEQILNDFKNKKYNILVSTTVIEVGIDIPDVTMMVIENAERFGLAQLHQLRGRIGRNDIQSYCYVIPGQETTDTPDVKERLQYFASHPSGFEVADYDLQRRGPGEVYGTKQSGIPQFKVASIHDLETLKKGRKVARELLMEDNSCDNILENLFK
jgi:ATP-dependent DNA helicase RecG